MTVQLCQRSHTDKGKVVLLVSRAGKPLSWRSSRQTPWVRAGDCFQRASFVPVQSEKTGWLTGCQGDPVFSVSTKSDQTWWTSCSCFHWSVWLEITKTCSIFFPMDNMLKLILALLQTYTQTKAHMHTAHWPIKSWRRQHCATLQSFAKTASNMQLEMFAKVNSGRHGLFPSVCTHTHSSL